MSNTMAETLLSSSFRWPLSHSYSKLADVRNELPLRHKFVRLAADRQEVEDVWVLERLLGQLRLRRPEGATLDQISKSLDWQPHSVRGAMSGTLKKKQGLKITSDKTEGRQRIYRIAA